MKTATKTCRICGLSRPASEDFCPSCTAPAKPEVIREREGWATVDTGLETRWGGGPINPTREEMLEALAQLDTPDQEHPNTWLSDDDGWTVDVYETGLVIFSHQDEDICERNDVSRDEALELWILLQQGQHDEIKRRIQKQA